MVQRSAGDVDCIDGRLGGDDAGGQQVLSEFVDRAAQRQHWDVVKEREPSLGNIGISVCCVIDNRLRDKEIESCSSLPPRSRQLLEV